MANIVFNVNTDCDLENPQRLVPKCLTVQQGGMRSLRWKVNLKNYDGSADGSVAVERTRAGMDDYSYDTVTGSLSGNTAIATLGKNTLDLAGVVKARMIYTASDSEVKTCIGLLTILVE